MTATSKFRGNPIYFDEVVGEWRYKDTDRLVVADWEDRPCGHCVRSNRADGHDACLGELPGVANACCGHGNPAEAYVQFTNGVVIRGFNVIEFMPPMPMEAEG